MAWFDIDDKIKSAKRIGGIVLTSMGTLLAIWKGADILSYFTDDDGIKKELKEVRKRNAPEEAANDAKYQTYLNTFHNLEDWKNSDFPNVKDSIPRLDGYGKDARTAMLYAIAYKIDFGNDPASKQKTAENCFGYLKSNKFLKSIENMETALDGNRDKLNDLFSRLKERPDITAFLVNSFSDKNLSNNYWQSKNAPAEFLSAYVNGATEYNNLTKFIPDGIEETAKTTLGKESLRQFADLSFAITVERSEFGPGVKNLFSVSYNRNAGQKLEADRGNGKGLDNIGFATGATPPAEHSLPALVESRLGKSQANEFEYQQHENDRQAHYKKFGCNEVKEYINPKAPKNPTRLETVDKSSFFGIFGKDQHYSLDVTNGNLTSDKSIKDVYSIIARIFKEYSSDENKKGILGEYKESIMQVIRDRQGNLGEGYWKDKDILNAVNNALGIKSNDISSQNSKKERSKNTDSKGWMNKIINELEPIIGNENLSQAQKDRQIKTLIKREMPKDCGEECLKEFIQKLNNRFEGKMKFSSLIKDTTPARFISENKVPHPQGASPKLTQKGMLSQTYKNPPLNLYNKGGVRHG